MNAAPTIVAMEPMVVPLAEVHVDSAMNVSREGKPITDDSVADLVADIGTHGQRDRVGLVPIGLAGWVSLDDTAQLLAAGKRFALIYGFRRTRACQLAGLDTVRADVAQAPVDRGPAELLNLTENWGRKPPTEYELTWAAHRMIRVHRFDMALVARRTNRTAAWIEHAVRIVERVDPTLLPWYRANSSAEVRRRMIALAAIEGPSAQARYQAQREQWTAWEQADAVTRRADPQGGVAPRGPDKQKRATQHLCARIRAVIDGPGPDHAKLATIRTLLEG